MSVEEVEPLKGEEEDGDGKEESGELPREGGREGGTVSGGEGGREGGREARVRITYLHCQWLRKPTFQ